MHRAAPRSGAPRGPSACYTPAVLKPSGTPREPRRSAIALASRIGRPEWRPSDQTKAIRRSVGGSSREMSIQTPDQGLGFVFGAATWNADACVGRLRQSLTHLEVRSFLCSPQAFASTPHVADSQFRDAF